MQYPVPFLTFTDISKLISQPLQYPHSPLREHFALRHSCTPAVVVEDAQITLFSEGTQIAIVIAFLKSFPPSITSEKRPGYDKRVKKYLHFITQFAVSDGIKRCSDCLYKSYQIKTTRTRYSKMAVNLPFRFCQVQKRRT